MRLLLCLLGIALSAQAADFKIGAHTFTLPDGFEIEAVAAPPLVDRPITMAFDETGALYVSDSSGSNDKPDAQVKNPTHRVLRLVDKDGDGKFDDSTVFAGKLSFPEGTMWLDGSLYVSAPPQIWKLTDTDADGIADKREVWFDGKTLTGCANDLHGPYAGPDGFIYWCKGAFAEQRHTLADGKQLVTKASHVFRMRPDGTGLENVMTGGMDNPVDVVFTPGGERLVSGTFFVHPGGGQRDGILHAVWGGVYGKDHAVLDGHPRTGELMPIMTHLGPAAPCGLELTRSPAWGTEWLGNVFCAQFNLRKISRHVLAPDGATFKTTDSDFVVSDNADFHPTDLIEDADGTLLIADTGGWYKLCCPTSTLAKADVLGAIYRVKKKDAPRVDDPRGLKLDWQKADAATLASRLADPRPVVADRAMAALAKLGDAAIPHISTLISTPRVGANTTPTTARLNAIWTFTRIPGDAARAAVRFAFADKDPLVRIAAAHSASLWRDAGATEALINHLSHADPQLRRIAAEAIGRIGDKRAAPHLLAAAPENADRFLEHTLATALVEIDATEAARAALTKEGASQRIAISALQQLGVLKAAELLPLLDSKDSQTRNLAVWTAERHPAWGKELVNWIILQDFQKTDSPAIALLARLSSSAYVQHAVAALTADAHDPSGLEGKPGLPESFGSPALVSAGLAAMRQSGLKELPKIWADALARLLRDGSDAQNRLVLETIRSFASSKKFPADLRQTVRAFALDSEAPNSLRLLAFEAVPGGVGQPDEATFAVLKSSLQPGEPLSERTTAARLLASAKLTGPQLTDLIASLHEAPPAVLATLLGAFGTATDEAIGQKLVATLADHPALPSLPAATLNYALAKFPSSVKQAAEPLFQKLAGQTAAQHARLDVLAAELLKGDVRRGHQIFRGTKSACTTCHAMAYAGGNLGPDLTKIGATRTERDLLEALVFPSASFVRSYEPVFVKTKAGDQLGIVKKDAADEVVLATGVGTEAHIARADVLDMQPAAISLMPQGYDGILTPQELADLVAFLKAQK